MVFPSFGRICRLRLRSVDETGVNSLLNLLVIDDDQRQLTLLHECVRQEGLNVATAFGSKAGMETFHSLRPKIVVIDLASPVTSGMEVLEQIVATDPGVEVILMTENYSPESAVEAIKKGAADYLTKPTDLDKLRTRVSSLLAEAAIRKRTADLDHQLMGAYQFHGMVGRSPLMLELYAKIRRVAPHYRTILVGGPTGTGKELVARALHGLSPVSTGPFVVCNCSAIVDTLAESELFGYSRGAFTGASQDRKGVFEAANGGTVFLDEIGELPLIGQAKLLRVLQNREIQRVGSTTLRAVDIRVIAATNRNLEEMVKEGQFREDLYYRLAMVEICLPRLADRKEDIPLLKRHFVEQFAAAYNKPITGFTRRAQIKMAAYSWPGNVRQLENVIGSVCMMADGPLLDLDDLPKDVRDFESTPLSEDAGFLSLEELQRRHVVRVLECVGGNKARAAEILGVGRNTIYHFLSKIHNDRSEHFAVHEPVGGGSQKLH